MTGLAGALVAALLLTFALVRPAMAYQVGPAVSLDKMTDMADLVVKAKVVSSTRVQQAGDREIGGFALFDTKLQIITVLKGNPGASNITFRHYSTYEEEGRSMGRMFTPQHYEFMAGRSYIVFAKSSSTSGAYEGLFPYPIEKVDEGVLRASDDLPLPGKSVKDACWLTLTGCCASTNADDVVYGLQQLDQMSGGAGVPVGTLNDFARDDVIGVVRPLLKSSNDKVLLAAIEVAGSHGPYMVPGDAPFWLASKPGGHLSGLGPRDLKIVNRAGQSLWHELAAIVDSQAPSQTRALAVSALGKCGVAELAPLVDKWLTDPKTSIRQSAVLLLADYPNYHSRQLIDQATRDVAPGIRQQAALAVGFGDFSALVPRLVELMSDDNRTVRGSAVMSLLSFKVEDFGDKFRRCAADANYGCLFVNILAASDPASYLTNLQEMIVQDPRPDTWWGGSIPSGESWDILFKYVQSRPSAELQSGKLDASLDALEKSHWYSSSGPRDLYALYVQRGLTERAKAFRAATRNLFSNMDEFYDQVDRNPNVYRGN